MFSLWERPSRALPDRKREMASRFNMGHELRFERQAKGAHRQALHRC